MKNSYQTCLLVLCLTIYSLCSFGQSNSFTNKYNLYFDPYSKTKSPWKLDKTNPFVIQQDSTQTIHGKNPLCLTQVKTGRQYFRFKGIIKQTILLPETNADSITVSLNCKSQNLLHSRLIICGIDDNESILYTDTLSLLGSAEWRTFSLSVPNHNVVLLNLSIEAEALNDKSQQCLYLDKLDIRLDGKDINSFPLPTIPIISDIKKRDLISMSFSNDTALNKMSALENKKIVAIGETVHGSETITEVAAQLIKHQVEHNNCKLILLEMPIEQTLFLNRYIRGDSLFKNDNLTQELSRFFFSPRIMLDLLNWLKKYNEKTRDMVWLFGIDLDLVPNRSAIYLYDYLYRIKENKQNVLLDSLCSKLYDYNSFPQALQILEKNKGIENLLGKNEYRILHHLLSLSIDAGIGPLKRFCLRDKQMYLNAAFLLNLLCPANEKVTIYEHFIHTNYKNTDPLFPFTNTFGSYMKNKYGNNYYSIAVLVGEGSFRTSDKDSTCFKMTLQVPPKNSLENLFMRTNEPFCFLPILKLPPQLTYLRVMGNSYLEEQFAILAPASRMDAAIFVRNSKAFDILNGYLSHAHDYNMYLLKQLQINNDRYRQKKVINK